MSATAGIRPRQVLSLLLPALLLVSCDAQEPDPDADKTTITILFAYTPQVRAAADVEALIDRALDDTHRAYDNSGIRTRLRRAHAVEVNYTLPERLQDLTRLVRRSDGYLDELHALRDAHEADLVVLIADAPTATQNAAIMAEPSTAFAVVYYAHLGAPHFALGHELGHLQGARHSPEQGVFAEPFPYGHGTRTEQWKTIMASGSVPVIPHFSNPDVSYQGTPTGTADLQNVARVLNETAVYIANFRGPQTPTDFVPTATFPIVETE